MEHANTDPVGAVAEETPEQLLARAKAEGNPWAKMAGIFRDDSLFDEWVEIMRENRRKEDIALDLAEADGPDDPARRFAGILRDNSLFDEWQEAMRDIRQQADNAQEIG